MVLRTLNGLLCLALAGCNGGSDPIERVDYGADIVVGYVTKAESECTAVATPSLDECAELPRSATRGRLAAISALDAYASFQSMCCPDLGTSKCEALIELAYREAKSR